MSNFRATC
jgi:hypothetical protein